MSKTDYWYTEMYTGIYLPVKVDVIRMKKLYISEINSVYFCWPERNKKYILAQSVH